MEQSTIVLIGAIICASLVIAANMYGLRELNMKSNVCEKKFDGVSLKSDPSQCYVNGTLYDIEKLSDGQYIKVPVVRK